MNRIQSASMACILALFCLVAPLSSPAQTLTTMISFNGIDGDYPTPGSPLVQATNGNLYGVTYYGGSPTTCFYSSGTGCGTVFSMTTAAELTSLYSFCSQPNCSDGADPVSIIQGSDGNFYGVTAYDGQAPNTSECCGTIFQITPAGTLTTLYRFCSKSGCPDGKEPQALIQASDGNFYGVTFLGGAYGLGTIFQFTPAGKFTTIYSFCAVSGCPDGDSPVALMQDSNKNLYGATYGGGMFNGGLIFEFTPAGTLTVLTGDVRKPNTLIQAGKDLFGTTAAGGTGSHGIVYRLTPSGVMTTIHNFCPLNCSTGDSPLSGAVLGSDGNLYGTTFLAGITYYAGSVYQITSTGAFNTLYLFCSLASCADGDEGEAMMEDTNGEFYGITGGGGLDGRGTIFNLSIGLDPFVAARPSFASAGEVVTILGNNLKDTTSVTFNGVPAAFTVGSDTYITARVPAGASSGAIVVTTSHGTLNSTTAFQVTP
jgi:uncharacterized repeat protein (TIGR03803 family)